MARKADLREYGLQIKYSIGNMKVGDDTLIMNITSATDCPSKKKGFCDIKGARCYALKAEELYKNVLQYRRCQEQLWDLLTADQIAMQINEINRQLGIRYVRFQESGDFRNQEDLNKMARIASLIVPLPYVYTARRDLDFSGRGRLVVNGSGFMVDNSFNVMEKTDSEDGRIMCAMNCRVCDLCKFSKGIEIYNKKH